MTALTDAQIDQVRAETGDDVESDYDVPDVALQAIWADANMANGSLPRLNVYVLRRRLGKLAKKVGLSGEFGNAQYQQEFEHIRDTLLPYWEKIAGMQSDSLPVLSVGVLNLGIDTTCEDEWPL